MSTNSLTIRLVLLITSLIYTSSACSATLGPCTYCSSCSFIGYYYCSNCCPGFEQSGPNPRDCVPIPSLPSCSDPNCDSCSSPGTFSEICNSCVSSNYYPLTGTPDCKLCTAASELNCNSINGCGVSTSTCANCLLFGMNSAGQCLSCGSIYRNCYKCTNTQCVSCSSGYLNTTSC